MAKVELDTHPKKLAAGQTMEPAKRFGDPAFPAISHMLRIR
jgi:hypothetical protein